jgi:hypothetical protein
MSKKFHLARDQLSQGGPATMPRFGKVAMDCVKHDIDRDDLDLGILETALNQDVLKLHLQVAITPVS